MSGLLAGLSLTYMRAFRIGDRVKIEDVEGDVVEMGLAVTRLKTAKNEIVTVPNTKIMGGYVTNYSLLAREKRLILHTTVTIGYDAPWRQVHALLLQAAQRTPGLLRDPPPFVLQRELGDFAVAYQLNVYTDNANAMGPAYSRLHQGIQDAFNEYGVQIMSPHYEADRAQPTLVPKDRWYAPPATPPE